MTAARPVLARIGRAALWLACAGLLAMTVIISAQVFARFVVGQSLAWSEQAALLLMIWTILPAAAVGVREGFHVRVTALVNLLPARMQRRLALVSHALTALFGLAMLVWGSELVVRTWTHDIPAVGLPRGFGYVPLPLSGLLIALFAAEQAWALRRTGADGQPWR